MVKPRTKKATNQEIERFAAGADGGERKPGLDPDAKRDYKTVHIGFNQYEHEALVRLSKKVRRSRMGTIRWAVVELDKMNLKEE